MFELNPLANPDAFWQHALMLVIAALLGYLIGYVSGNKTNLYLEEELKSLEKDLENCQNPKSVIVHTDPVFRTDDLKVIEGIGPGIETILNQAGIVSWYQLSQKTPDQISAILVQQDARMQMHDPSSWPQQAGLANNGEWEKLKAWQDRLNGGRQV